MLKSILFVGFGSFIGGISRYLISLVCSNRCTSDFPYATFIVNIIGCALIGAICGLASRFNLLNHDLRLFLSAGFCGGFTTFSSFMLDNIILLKNGNFFISFIYLSLSIIIGILFTYISYILTR